MYLVDATPLQSEHRQRGVGTYVRELSRALVRIAHNNVEFVAAKNGQTYLPPEVHAQSYMGFRGHRPAQLYWLYNEWFLREAIVKRRPTLFHATDFNGLVSMPGIVTVATLHDMMALKDPAHSAHSMSQYLSTLRWKIYFKKLHGTDAIITVSQAVKNDSVRYLGLDPNIITAIHPGVDTTRFRPDAPLQRSLAAAGQYFLCVGVCEPHKNYPRILAAFANAVRETRSEVALLIGGRWAPEHLRWLVEASRSFGVGDRVHHLGYVPSEALPGLYANALAFLFPSIDEGFGLPLIEAMASGTPFVSSDRGAPAEVSGSAGILVDPLDVGALTHALTDIIRHPRLRALLRKSGLERSHSFTWDAVARQTISVYEQALLRRTSSA